MRVIIKEVEINVALKAYMETCGLDLTDQVVEIDLQATRGPEGYTATIDISPAGSVAQEAEELPVINTKPAIASTNTATNEVVTPVRRGPGRPPKNPVATASEYHSEPTTPDPEPAQDIEEEEQVAVVAESEETKEEEAPAPTPRPSLFGGLNRPSNA